MRVLLGFVAALALATPALADDWWFFSLTGEVAAYVDVSSIGRLPSGARSVAFRRFDPQEWAEMRGVSIYEFAETWVVDCAGRRARPMHSAIFGWDGALINEADIPHPANDPRWVAATPESNVERMVAVVCRNDRAGLRDTSADTIPALRALVRGASQQAPSKR
jgi:hypothetical protein